MNRFDVLLLAVVALFLILGAWRGLVRLLLGVAGFVVGVVVAVRWEAEATALARRAVDSDLFAPMLAFVGVVLLVTAAFAVAAWLIRKLLTVAHVGWLDRLLGAAAGVVCALLFAGGVSLFVASGGATPRFLAESKVAPLALQVSRGLARLAPPELRARFEKGVQGTKRAAR